MHALAALLAAAATLDLGQLAWMAGHWRASEGGRTTEELWLAPSGGVMLGLNRSVSTHGTAFEFLRIAAEDAGIVYLASPQGRAPTRFTLDAGGQGWVRFGNPEHDYPKLVTYRAVGEHGLQACVGDGDRESCWTWQRVGAAGAAR